MTPTVLFNVGLFRNVLYHADECGRASKKEVYPVALPVSSGGNG